MKRPPRLPLDDEHTVGYAILEACWPIVEAHVPMLHLRRGDWRSRNAVAARTLGRNGYVPQDVAELLTLAYEHPRLARNCTGMTSLHKLIDLIPKIELIRTAPPDPNLVPFGKYVDKPVAMLLADKDYCEFMIAQPGFRERHQDIYNVIINAGIAPSETPEHNAMQAHFLDDAWCLRVARALGLRGTVVEDRKFEYKSCWDVRFVVRGDDIGHTTVLLELKPDLGDDYPVVLRQVQRYPNGARCVRAVVVQRYGFESVTWAQVVAIFAASNIALLVEPDGP